VVSLILAPPNATVMTVCENGYGKRTPLAEYRVQGRGGMGIINIKTTERNGDVVGVLEVTDDDDLLIATQQGQVVRTPVQGHLDARRAHPGRLPGALQGRERQGGVGRPHAPRRQRGGGNALPTAGRLRAPDAIGRGRGRAGDRLLPKGEPLRYEWRPSRAPPGSARHRELEDDAPNAAQRLAFPWSPRRSSRSR
jgi:hypothetical protein